MIQGELVEWNWTFAEAIENGWYQGIYWADKGNGTHQIKEADGTIIDVEAIRQLPQSKNSREDIIISLLTEIRDILK